MTIPRSASIALVILVPLTLIVVASVLVSKNIDKIKFTKRTKKSKIIELKKDSFFTCKVVFKFYLDLVLFNVFVPIEEVVHLISI